MCLLYLLLIFCSFSDWTPLHYAALKGRVEVVQLLLSCNAAIDTKDNGYRPYRCAVDQNRFLIFCCIAHLIRFCFVPLATKPRYTTPPRKVALKSCSCCCRATPLSTRKTTGIAPTAALLIKIDF